MISVLASCEESESLIDISDQVQFLNVDFFGPCFYGPVDKKYHEITFTDNQSYQIFGNSIRVNLYNMDCQSADITIIDFNKYSLIGKYTSGGGCSSQYERQILDDKVNKKLIYKIKVQYSGDCELYFFNMNWALIPKLENGYKIEFQVE